jgi:hypothetical protein
LARSNGSPFQLSDDAIQLNTIIDGATIGYITSTKLWMSTTLGFTKNCTSIMCCSQNMWVHFMCGDNWVCKYSMG